MNAVEIEEAISALAEEPFDPVEFPYQFLVAFGNKETTIKRLRKGSTNQSDLDGGLLQRNNIHIKACQPGEVGQTLAELVASPATAKQKAKYALATDGEMIEAENLVDGETLACEFSKLGDHFGFFLSLAGIATIKQIRDNAFDIKATGRMNRLYVELQKINPDWDTEERREELNHFFARLIFCFFAEDTGIFPQNDIFTSTVQKMSDPDASNTHEIISEVFRAMNLDEDDREGAGLPRYASSMPYVNGGLFEGSTECPKFTKIARSYLIHIGGLDWTKINPDIFGAMIQAVAEDEERGELGMHYTSVPNILKVLNPLLLDELRQQLEDAEDNKRKLLNLRNRMARIRVFDPACGSGNFLVVAYKEMRKIAAEINRRRGESDRASDIPLTNFRGIEIRSFAAEVARLALVIAKFQCDLESRGTQRALFDAIPLSKSNWIICGNALRLNWTELCPPTSTAARLSADDLFETPLDQSEIDFENEGGEVYICGNPPFAGSRKQTKEQKRDLEDLYAAESRSWKKGDLVIGWFYKAAKTGCRFAFVATNSICQGEQVPILWPYIFQCGLRIRFAHTSFSWSNMAKKNAGVTVVILGIDGVEAGARSLYTDQDARDVKYISPYLTPSPVEMVGSRKSPLFGQSNLDYGVYYSKSQGLLLSQGELTNAKQNGVPDYLVKFFTGTEEFLNGKIRYCLWISDDALETAYENSFISNRIKSVREEREGSKDPAMQKLSARPHQFREFKGGETNKVIVPNHTSENREYLTPGILSQHHIVSNAAFADYSSSPITLSLISSRLHLIWISTVCGGLETRIRYSSTIGWNNFPIPSLSQSSREALTISAEDILLARESYWPATIADMYDPDRMDTEFPRLREAHEHNDEVLERIYIGRRFKNDTERLEKLFEMYAAATEKEASA